MSRVWKKNTKRPDLKLLTCLMSAKNKIKIKIKTLGYLSFTPAGSIVSNPNSLEQFHQLNYPKCQQATFMITLENKMKLKQFLSIHPHTTTLPNVNSHCICSPILLQNHGDEIHPSKRHEEVSMWMRNCWDGWISTISWTHSIWRNHCGAGDPSMGDQMSYPH